MVLFVLIEIDSLNVEGFCVATSINIVLILRDSVEIEC